MPTKRLETIELRSASLSTRRFLRVIRYGDLSYGKKAYIQTGLHADEAPGLLVMHHLIELLDAADQEDRITSQIILVPVANPIGWDQWDHEYMQGRFETASGINFNREHPDIAEEIATRIGPKLGRDPKENKAVIRKAAEEVIRNLSPLDEGACLKKELQALSFDADIVLDLHCDDRAVLHMYTGTPLWPDLSDLAAWIGARLVILSKESGGNPYDEGCSKIWWELAERFPHCPIPSACLAATLELRGIFDVSRDLALQDARNLFFFLQERVFVRGERPDSPAHVAEAYPLEGVLHVRAPGPGVVTYEKRPGDRVKKGDCIARIYNPIGPGERKLCEVVSDIDGLLFSLKTARLVRPGMILAKVAGEKALEGKGPLLLTP